MTLKYQSSVIIFGLPKFIFDLNVDIVVTIVVGHPHCAYLCLFM